MSLIEGENPRPRIIQQGPLPNYFVTGLVAIDVQPEYVAMVFSTEQRWGGLAAPECELSFRMVVPMSCMTQMRAQVAAKMGGPPAAH
jgi:hypothetical protein